MKKGLVFILLTALLFATYEPVGKMLSGTHPLGLCAVRFLIGGLVLLPFALIKLKKSGVHLQLRDFLMMGLLGILCILVSMGLLQLAVNTAVNTALIAIIFSANAVSTLLFAALFLREKLTWMKIAAAVLCAVGVVISADIRGGESLPAILYAVGAALAFSLYTVLSKKLVSRCPGLVQTSFAFLMGGAFTLAFVALTGANPFAGLTPAYWPHLAYLGVMVTGVGYWAYFAAMEASGAYAASLAFFIKPILAPIAAWAILGLQPTNPVLWISLALVMAGSVLGVLSRKPKSKNIQRQS